MGFKSDKQRKGFYGTRGTSKRNTNYSNGRSEKGLRTRGRTAIPFTRRVNKETSRKLISESNKEVKNIDNKLRTLKTPSLERASLRAQRSYFVAQRKNAKRGVELL